MAKQNVESEDDFMKMQQEAVRRVREMQSRARATLEKAGMHIENGETETAQSGDGETNRGYYSSDIPRHNDMRRETIPNEAARENIRLDNAHEHFSMNENRGAEGEDEPDSGSKPAGVTGFNLSLDSDQLLLLATLYLLIKDGADKWLILSLAYILLS